MRLLLSLLMEVVDALGGAEVEAIVVGRLGGRDQAGRMVATATAASRAIRSVEQMLMFARRGERSAHRNATAAVVG